MSSEVASAWLDNKIWWIAIVVVCVAVLAFWLEFRQGPTSWERDREWLRTHRIDVGYDSEGNVYTTHVVAQDGDPWMGARILSATCVAHLRETGEWPLREAKP